jgi:hypothetical protein
MDIVECPLMTQSGHARYEKLDPFLAALSASPFRWPDGRPDIIGTGQTWNWWLWLVGGRQAYEILRRSISHK